LSTRWVLPHGLQLKVEAVIDMNQNLDKNDEIVHAILSNLETDGANRTQNKKRLEDMINQRTNFYKIQLELISNKLPIIIRPNTA